MNVFKLPLLFLIAVYMIAGLVACSIDENSEANQNETPQSEDQQNQDGDSAKKEKTPPSDAEGQKDNFIEISATEMKFSPNKITLKKGTEYELILNNEGEVFHDLTEDKMNTEITFMSDMPSHSETSFLNQIIGTKVAHADGDHDKKKQIHLNSKSGQSVSIKFIPEETGEFEFYCSIPGHKEAGMKGTFIVTE